MVESAKDCFWKGSALQSSQGETTKYANIHWKCDTLIIECMNGKFVIRFQKKLWKILDQKIGLHNL